MAESDVQTRASLSKLRQREAELDARASLVDTRTDLKFSEGLEIAARGMFFTRHFMGRFLAKNLLMFFAITVPVTIMNVVANAGVDVRDDDGHRHLHERVSGLAGVHLADRGGVPDLRLGRRRGTGL